MKPFNIQQIDVLYQAKTNAQGILGESKFCTFVSKYCKQKKSKADILKLNKEAISENTFAQQFLQKQRTIVALYKAHALSNDTYFYPKFKI